MTTLAGFISGLAALNVTGVRRTYAYPPASLSNADLPALWVQLPSLSNDVIAFKAGVYWATLKAQIVVALEAVAQSTQAGNFSQTVTMLDNLISTLQGADVCAGPLSVAVRVAVVEVAGAAFWAVIADVEGKG
jgi:hypothetical protein